MTKKKNLVERGVEALIAFVFVYAFLVTLWQIGILSMLSFLVQIGLTIRNEQFSQRRVFAIGVNSIIGFAAGAFIKNAINDVFVGAFWSALIMVGIYVFVVRGIRIE